MVHASGQQVRTLVLRGAGCIGVNTAQWKSRQGQQVTLVDRIDETAGRASNTGGGPDRPVAISREFGQMVESLTASSIQIQQADWRPGDQRANSSSARLAQSAFA